MPRPEKKPSWWGDPAVQAVVRRGLLYLIKNIYGEIPSCVKVCLKQKANSAVIWEQNNKKGISNKNFNSEVEYNGACQGIYDDGYDNSEDLSTADVSQDIKSNLEAEISEVSMENVLSESIQNDSEISYISSTECFIQLLQRLYPEAANCLRQADHTSPICAEDLCACISAKFENIKSSEAENDFKNCLLQFIEQLYPNLISCTENNNANESVSTEELENVEGTKKERAECTVNGEDEPNTHGDYVGKTEFVLESNKYLTAEETAPERAINDEFETEDSHDSLEECLMKVVRQICPEIANRINQGNGSVLKPIESGEKCDFEEENGVGREEELLDKNADPDEEEIVEDDENYEATTDSLRDCLGKLFRQLYPEITSYINPNGDQIDDSVVDISTETSKVESTLRSCLLEIYSELVARIKQSLRDYDNNDEEEILEEEDAEDVQENEESRDDVADDSNENNNGEVGFNEDILKTCLFQFIQHLHPELFKSGAKGMKPDEEINEGWDEEYYDEQGEIIVEDEQIYEDIQSEGDEGESKSNEHSLKECLIQLIQQLYPEETICVDNSENAESEESEIEESEGTKVYFSERNEGEKEIPSEWIEETLGNCFVSLVEHMHPEMASYIQQSTGAETDIIEENAEEMDLEENMKVDTVYEVQELDDNEENISEYHSDGVSNSKELPEDSQAETTQEDEEDVDSVPECGDENLKECLLQVVQQLYPELADCIKHIEDSKPQDSEGTQTEVSTVDESTETDSDLKDRMLQFFKIVYPELANCTQQEGSGSGNRKGFECTEETLGKCFLGFVEQLRSELANCIKETVGETSTLVGENIEEKGENEECGDVKEIIMVENFPEIEYFERSVGEQAISRDKEVEEKCHCKDRIEDQVHGESENLTQDEGSRESEVNNDADTECSDENMKKKFLLLIQKLYSELAKCIRKYESGKMSDSEESDVEDSTVGESDLKESLSQFIGRNYPELAHCFKLNEDVDSISPDGSEIESECDDETMRTHFLKFVEELYPDLAICIKQSLGGIWGAAEEINEEEGGKIAERSGTVDDEANTDERELKESSDQSECTDILDKMESDNQCERDDTITDRSGLNDENKTECSDNSLRECLMQFIQQMCPELVDCVKQYNDSNPSDDEISDVSISEVSEALEASSRDGDIKDCLLKFIDILYPDLAKCIREFDNRRKPCESEGSVVDILEGNESASSGDSLRECLINFVEEVYPELADCIKHAKRPIKVDDNEGKESEKTEVDKDETTIDESILDEVKIEQTLNEKGDEDSHTEILPISEQRGDEASMVSNYLDDEEKSEMTITPDQFTEDVQIEPGAFEHQKSFEGQSEVTVTDDADDKTEIQSVELSQEISITEYIQPLISSNETQIDDEGTLSSEDIFEDCFLRIVEQLNPDLACCIMQSLPEHSTPQIKDSNESGEAISEQLNEFHEQFEDLSKMECGLVEENPSMVSEILIGSNNDTNLENSGDLMTEENFSMASEIVTSVENSNPEGLSEFQETIENSSTASEVFVSENVDNSLEESVLNEEVSAANKIEEISIPEALPSDNSRAEENIGQYTTVLDNFIQESEICRELQFEYRQENQQNCPNAISFTREVQKGPLGGAFGKKESKFDEVSEEVQEEKADSTTERSVGERDMSLSEYKESDGHVESPVVEENTDGEAESKKKFYSEWTESTSTRDPEPVKKNNNIKETGFMEEQTEVPESEVTLDIYTENSEGKDKSSIEDSATETSEENDDELDELRGCLLAIANEFYPELANCIRKCLADEEEGMISDPETDRRNMQLCLENFAAKFYARPALKPEQDTPIPGIRNVEEMPAPTVKYIQQLILDFAQIFHPKLADILQQQ